MRRLLLRCALAAAAARYLVMIPWVEDALMAVYYSAPAEWLYERIEERSRK